MIKSRKQNYWKISSKSQKNSYADDKRNYKSRLDSSCENLKNQTKDEIHKDHQ